ncbi:MAG: hypothetical protein WC728_14420 [Elusimicrobiota bacterium]
MADCVLDAKETHAFTNRTTTAEKSIRIANRARSLGSRTLGIWGSVACRYFKYLEFGTKFTRTRTTIRQRMRLMRTGVFKRPKNAGAPPWQGGSWSPTLRATAARIYPRLAANIREAFKRGG